MDIVKQLREIESEMEYFVSTDNKDGFCRQFVFWVYKIAHHIQLKLIYLHQANVGHTKNSSHLTLEAAFAHTYQAVGWPVRVMMINCMSYFGMLAVKS